MILATSSFGAKTPKTPQDSFRFSKQPSLQARLAHEFYLLGHGGSICLRFGILAPLLCPIGRGLGAWPARHQVSRLSTASLRRIESPGGRNFCAPRTDESGRRYEETRPPRVVTRTNLRRNRMPRRFALAAALAMTVVVTYSLVVVGANAGLFSAKGDQTEAADVPAYVAPAIAAPEEAPTALPTQAPVVITEYVYVDVPAPRPAGQQAPTMPPAPTATAPVIQSAPQAVSSDSSSREGGAGSSASPSEGRASRITASAPTVPAAAAPTSSGSSSSHDDDDEHDDHDSESHEDND